MESDDNCGFVTGKLLWAIERDRLDGAGDALLMGGGAYRLGHHDPDMGQFETRCWVMAGCGAATLFRRSVLQEIHGLDEDFFAYLDDIDLAMRAQLMGHTGYYVPEAVAYHIGSATLGRPSHPRVIELMTRNQLYLIAKCYPISVLWKLLPRILAFQTLWFGLVLRRRHLLAYLRGFLAAVRSMHRILRKRKLVLQRKRLTNLEFLKILANSERQIFDWHSARPSDSRSKLLNLYFRLFPARP
jgi:hypothetical protein